MDKFNKVKSFAKMSVLAVSMFGASSVYAGGVPVIDVAGLGEAVTQTIQQVNQLENQVKQFESLNGRGVLGQLLRDPQTRALLNKHLPNGYTDIMDAVNRNDLGALQKVYSGVIQQEKYNRQNMTGKERLASTMLVNKAQTQAMMQSLDVRSRNIDILANQINGAVDAKTKADLANRINAETALINVDMNKMQVALQMQAQNEKLAQRQVMGETRSKLIGR